MPVRLIPKMLLVLFLPACLSLILIPAKLMAQNIAIANREFPRGNNLESGPSNPVGFKIEVNTFTGNLLVKFNLHWLPDERVSMSSNVGWSYMDDVHDYYEKDYIPLLSYNSGKTEVDKGFGHGVSSFFNIWIEKLIDSVKVNCPDGREEKFTWNGSAYVAEAGVFNTLVEYETGKFLLTTKHGIKYYFANL